MEELDQEWKQAQVYGSLICRSFSLAALQPCSGQPYFDLPGPSRASTVVLYLFSQIPMNASCNVRVRQIPAGAGLGGFRHSLMAEDEPVSSLRLIYEKASEQSTASLAYETN